MTRERWTDERLDKSFDRIDADLRELRVEVKRGFERIDGKFDAMQSEINQRFDSMQRTMFIGFVTLLASVIGALFVG